MKIFFPIILVTVLFYSCEYNSVPEKIYPGWKVYNTSNSNIPFDNLGSIAIDSSQNIWIGSSQGGIIKFDQSWFIFFPTYSDSLGFHSIDATADIACYGNVLWICNYSTDLINFNSGTWRKYNYSNSGMPPYGVRDLQVDQNGNIWMATTGGIVNFNGVNWNIYNSSNSGLPANEVLSVEVDKNNVVWASTMANIIFGGTSGLARFDASIWSTYTTANSGLPSNAVFHISSETSGKVWLTNGLNLTSFDMLNWNSYLLHDAISPSSNVIINSLTTEEGGIIWIGTDHGLFRFNGFNWQQFTTSNSGIPSNKIVNVAIDKLRNKWITTDKGLAVYSSS